LSENIIQLWAELGTPQAQTDSTIVKYYRDSPEQLGLHEEDISRLRSKRDRLTEEKRLRERRLKELKSTVEALWEKLGVEEYERKSFLNGNRGCGVRQINEFEDELSRLNELKRQNLHLFVEDARFKLQALWDSLYFSEDEMLEFTPAFSDVYSDALLDAHEQEITRLETLREQRAPTLALIDKHRSLVKDRDDLAASSQDASRLMMRGQKGEKRDPTRLLREEKMRKRIAKELPKVAVELRKALEQWEDEYGRPFLVHGERYIDELDASETKAPGPRSKTPSGFSGTASVRGQKAPLPPSRANSVSRASSVRGPPSRQGAKTPTGNGTIRRNPLGNSVSTAGGRTPSRIPGRAPLANLQHGNNSPERRTQLESTHDTGTIRKMASIGRAPPPKMRDLFVPPQEVTPARHTRGESIVSVGSVRHVSPEDVYDDRASLSYTQQQRVYPQSQNYDMPPHGRFDERYSKYAPPPAHRQISNSSSVATTTVSGSENWETYDDASEADEDEYYTRMRDSHGKRYTPEDGYMPSGNVLKRSRGYTPVGSAGHENTESGQDLISSIETKWSEEEAF
jgi:protein regulator of cytokinesis 1